ncbi:hypothetical protein Bca52824_031765 [Brassica carinata]|uniref:Uncharacterized protein n=1 Tax=Brassica carinata TaxID=52824 RepID=A0A8X7SFK8_BRACI|nr:hypothetical protein Bca52824_031765 [Brassica carinata]
MDEHIFNNDVQIRSYVVATYKGHTQEVCGLKWSGSGQRLASGGKDSLMHLWDRSSSTQWLHRLMGHTSAVKALVCPFQSNLLASGDHTVEVHCSFSSRRRDSDVLECFEYLTPPKKTVPRAAHEPFLMCLVFVENYNERH